MNVRRTVPLAVLVALLVAAVAPMNSALADPGVSAGGLTTASGDQAKAEREAARAQAKAQREAARAQAKAERAEEKAQAKAERAEEKVERRAERAEEKVERRAERAEEKAERREQEAEETEERKAEERPGRPEAGVEPDDEAGTARERGAASKKPNHAEERTATQRSTRGTPERTSRQASRATAPVAQRARRPAPNAASPQLSSAEAGRSSRLRATVRIEGRESFQADVGITKRANRTLDVNVQPRGPGAADRESVGRTSPVPATVEVNGDGGPFAAAVRLAFTGTNLLFLDVQPLRQAPAALLAVTGLDAWVLALIAFGAVGVGMLLLARSR